MKLDQKISSSYFDRTPNCAKLRYGKSALDTPPLRKLFCTIDVFGCTDTVVCDGENTLVFINGLDSIERLFSEVVAKEKSVVKEINLGFFLVYIVDHCRNFGDFGEFAFQSWIVGELMIREDSPQLIEIK